MPRQAACARIPLLHYLRSANGILLIRTLDPTLSCWRRIRQSPQFGRYGFREVDALASHCDSALLGTAFIFSDRHELLPLQVEQDLAHPAAR